MPIDDLQINAMCWKCAQDIFKTTALWGKKKIQYCYINMPTAYLHIPFSSYSSKTLS
ncbi:hypothetical protein Cadr_000011603 [Camelus dromedarius]|uniref:Uncharacterized protein n=1 Tax=Camelus dromedarius TaxID=9838 RepID=A0A5N4DVE7_CAMDR|nr:hypothetical protein Cadr_000011603 [Camelus dromedarius]